MAHKPRRELRRRNVFGSEHRGVNGGVRQCIPFLNEFIFGTASPWKPRRRGAVPASVDRSAVWFIAGTRAHRRWTYVDARAWNGGFGTAARTFLLGGAIAGVVVVLIGSTQTKTVQFEQCSPWLSFRCCYWRCTVVSPHEEAGVRSCARLWQLARFLSGHPQLILEVVFVAALFMIGLIVRYRTGLVRLGVAAGLRGDGASAVSHA